MLVCVLVTHTYIHVCVPLHEHVHTHTLSMLLLTVLTLFFIDLPLLIVHRLIALSLLHCELFPLKLCRHVTKYLMGRPVSDPVEMVPTVCGRIKVAYYLRVRYGYGYGRT